MLLKDKACVCRSSENCKSFVLQDKCNIEIFCPLVGTHIFFSGKNITLCVLKGILPFKMHEIIFFPEDQKKNLGFTSKYLSIFYLA